MFDEDGSLKGAASNDEDELIELFNSQKIVESEAVVNDQLRNDNDNDNHSLFEKADEVEKCEEGSGTILNSSQNSSNSPENDDFFEEEEHTNQLNQLTFRPGWKHSLSHPLDNLISPLNSGFHTRSKTRNLAAFLTIISSIEPKNVKELLGDAD